MFHGSLSKFADQINELMPQVIQGFARRQANELYKGKITLPQFLILEFLSRKGESRMTDMARCMHVTTAAMTGMVERLVGYGYVERVYDLKDRRTIRIRLTPSGNSLIKKINEQRRRMVINIFGGIPENDRREYLKILTQVRENLIKEDSPL
ncbi:MAG: MarR family transcriptional regulator [Candidatus Omnitrophica bacterium]|nr:MarR family transcriptional regulator [Candidatus Omnitrophota bacterium]MDD5553070.1 MarR family transcriptional regulator [Candidatus Omnitrophota bacterium]